MSCKLHTDYPDRSIMGEGTVVHATMEYKAGYGDYKINRSACGRAFSIENLYKIQKLDKSTAITCKRCLEVINLYKATESIDSGDLFVLTEKESGFFYRTSGKTSWTPEVAQATLYKTYENASIKGFKAVYTLNTGEEVSYYEFIRLPMIVRKGYKRDDIFDSEKYEVKKVSLQVNKCCNNL